MAILRHTDTIAAIATAPGRAALAIVRMSGPDAIRFADGAMRQGALAEAPSHTAHVGTWWSTTGAVIDQVVVTKFKAPATATGENIVEVACHGSDYVASRILADMLELGARMAEPGEFTQRAFLNGKMDLVQAEAVADLIHASSAAAHRVSLAQLQGRYSRRLAELRSALLEVCALAELEIDFADEDVEFADRGELTSILNRAAAHLQEALISYGYGELIREGVRITIAGRPNAGKSTLLNALLGEDRAIVSPEAGTTRDLVEADREVDGILFRFVDTAGLRAAPGAVEAEGVRRARKAVKLSAAVVYVYDCTLGLSAAEVAEIQTIAASCALILVGNKADLAPHCPPRRVAGKSSLMLSAMVGLGESRQIKPLWERLTAFVRGTAAESHESAIVTNRRHVQHMTRALESVGKATMGVSRGVSADIFTLDLRAALHELGCITGAITNEEVLGTIFSRFCIGK